MMNLKGQLIDNPNKDRALKILWESRRISEFDDAHEVVDFGLGRDFSVFVVKESKDTEFLKFVFKGKDNFQINEKLKLLNTKTESPIIDNSTSNKNFESCESMWSSTHLLYRTQHNDMKITSVGNDSHGQLFPKGNKEDNMNEIHIKDAAIGSEHGLILSDTEKVYAWGWGEHGNCGLQTNAKEKEDVTFDYLNLIFDSMRSDLKGQSGSKSHVIGLFCGCATSWVVLENDYTKT
ncbi:unnamed protein product [Ambrosiozyma monospora]|uniref:Unnamed protein product n=1 Tax=Ambrosiozyma monospora TaxID=43982 RepID=A0ACB5SW20_AMBMO|nr:unnamed protein product [Ambrosiozyma monospora]